MIGSRISLIILITLASQLSVYAPSSLAEQIKYGRKKVEQGYQFDYLWRDSAAQNQQISFVLSNQTLFDKFRNFRAFKSDIAQSYINKYIVKAWKKSPIPGAQLNLIKRAGKYQLQVNASSQTLMQQARSRVHELEQEATEDFFNKYYYHSFVTHDGVSAIKPDHVRIANETVESLKILKPLILETVSIKNVRMVTNYVLGFSQAIPYSPLESRVSSSGAGFNPPNKLLWENQGDCDSKVTLTAALLRALMPRIKMALVFIDGHALIGIEVMPQAGETTVYWQGTTYVLAEPTGPATYPLGQVAPDSLLAINSGRYTLETFHAEE